MLAKDLLNWNWKEINDEVNVDKHTTYSSTFMTLYDKNCPVKQYSSNKKYLESPWIFKGL